MKFIHLPSILSYFSLCLLPLMSAACSGSNDGPDALSGDGEEEVSAMTPAQLLHYDLVGNLYEQMGRSSGSDIYTPSRGIALDEARPSQRSETSESYEVALEAFGSLLPSDGQFQTFITRDDSGIGVDLGDLGSVRFSPASGDGIVARADIDLKGAPAYTLLYRHHSSFGDNYPAEQAFDKIYSPGDLVEFYCNKSVILNYWDKEPQTADGDEEDELYRWGRCGEKATGIVISVNPTHLAVLSDHVHYFYKYDKKKGTFIMHNNLVSSYGLQILYRSWKDYADAYRDTKAHNPNSSIANLVVDLMSGNRREHYICIQTNGFDRHRSLWRARWVWYSWQWRRSVDDLISGRFNTEYVRFAYRDELRNTYKEDNSLDILYLTEYTLYSDDDYTVLYPRY